MQAVFPVRRRCSRQAAGGCASCAAPCPAPHTPRPSYRKAGSTNAEIAFVLLQAVLYFYVSWLDPTAYAKAESEQSEAGSCRLRAVCCGQPPACLPACLPARLPRSTAWVRSR